MADIYVDEGANLQTIINNAKSGDTILLQPDILYEGNFVLPPHDGNDTITITTEYLYDEIDADRRITPNDSINLAKLRALPNGLPAIQAAPGARDWCLAGLEFYGNPNGYGDIIALGDGSPAQDSLDKVPRSFVIEQCYLHGDPVIGQKRAISLNAADVTIRGCHIDSIFVKGQDSQGICGWNSPGEWTIENNYIEAAGENILVGGDSIRIANLLPTDINISDNTIAKLPSWRDVGYNIKNLLELKTGVDVIINRNTFDFCWAGEGQSGFAIQITVRNEYGENPWATIRNVHFTNNKIRHAGGGINVLGKDDRGIESVLLSGLLIQDNEFSDIAESWGGSALWMQIHWGDHITLDHNTVILTHAGQAASVYFVDKPTTNFVMTNNILPNHGLCIFGDGQQAQGIPTLDEQAPGWEVEQNVLYDSGYVNNYPVDTKWEESIHTVGFTDPINGDFRLRPDSEHVGDATDGDNIGCRYVEDIEADLPEIPSRPDPDDAEVIDIKVTLRWEPSKNAHRYSVAFGEQDPPPIVSVGQESTSYVVDVIPDNHYYWQVTAINPNGSTRGPVWRFSV